MAFCNSCSWSRDQLSIKPQATQTLWEFVDFEIYVRESMKINKLQLKFHFLTKIEIKMTHLVILLCFYCFFAFRAI